jgi:hypothetical protein
LFGVHAQLDDFEGYLATYWFVLFSHPNGSHTSFANLLKEFIVADALARLFIGCNFGEFYENGANWAGSALVWRGSQFKQALGTMPAGRAGRKLRSALGAFLEFWHVLTCFTALFKSKTNHRLQPLPACLANLLR